MPDFAPMVASKEGASTAPGRYLLQVGVGVGPVAVSTRNGRVTLESGATGTPDVALRLTADQYARVVAGRQAQRHGTGRRHGGRRSLLGARFEQHLPGHLIV